MENNKKNSNKVVIEPKDILSLDIATKTGYYHTSDGGGVWNFTPTIKRNDRKQYKAMRETLIRFIKKHDIKIIVAEDVNVKTSFVALRKLSEFRGVLKEVCESLDLPEPIFINVTSVKYTLTGSGKASKELMIRTIKRKFQIDVEDDNHADAIAVFYHFSKNIRKYIK